MQQLNLWLLVTLHTNLVQCITTPGYLALDVRRKFKNDLVYLNRRQTTSDSFVAELTQNTNKLEYLVNITVGTPKQDLAVTLDTGSSDLWVPAVSSKPCKEDKCDDGSFNPENSSSYRIVDRGGFNITYAGPGDSDAGDWARDTISVGGSSDITGQQIGVALDGFDTHGVMGIGYDTNEASNPSSNGVYPSTLDNMVSQGLISRKAYSLYLNDLQASTGSIIFGGIDTTKYTGDLVALPLQAGPSGSVSEFFVTLTSVSFTDVSGMTTQLSPSGYAQAVLLDSGTSATLLTNEVFSALAGGFGAVDIGQAVYAVPCKYGNINGSINYSFGGDRGISVSVPMSQLIGTQYYDASEFNDASGGCDFGFGPLIDDIAIMGDTFLRSAYAVFDLDNQIAALAQAAVNQTQTSSIVAIPSGTSIPGASMTATVTGTQVAGAEATSVPSVPTASARGSTVLAGTPTFNLGSSPTGGGAGSSSSSGVAIMAAPTAALIGLGFAAGAMVW